MIPSTGTNFPESRFWRAVQSMTLPVKLVLAAVSASSYWWIEFPFGLLDDWSGSALGNTHWPLHTIAVIFGVLVMAPYAAASRMPLLRMLAMCVASALIYFLAIEFVADGPFSYNTVAPYLISGGGAALLVGLSIVMLVPRRASWRLFALCLVAGVIGGAAFEDSFWLGFGFHEIGGHLAWQVLVCLALHLGLRPTST